MWNRLKDMYWKPVKKNPVCNFTIKEAMILTGTHREILYPKLENLMDEAKRFCSQFSEEGE